MRKRIGRLLCAAAVPAWTLGIGVSSLHAQVAPSVTPAQVATSIEAPRWPFEWQSGRFYVHGDIDLRPRTDLMGQLQQLPEDLERQLGIRIENEPVHLILFAQQGTYRRYIAQHFPEVPYRRALFIRRRGPGMVFAFESREMATDLRHETAHALLNASLTGLPLWLDEGLAEYYEVPAADRATKNPHHRPVRLRARMGIVPELSSLEAIGDLQTLGDAHYRDAWSWVHFLLHHNDRTRAILIGHLRALQARVPAGNLSRRLAAEVPDYRERYLQHFRQ